MSPNYKLFKKWLKAYQNNNNIKIPERQDNLKDDVIPNLDYEVIRNCENCDWEKTWKGIENTYKIHYYLTEDK